MDVLIHDPGQDRLVDSVYVWVSQDPKTGLEGICAMTGPNGQALQAVCASPDLANRLEEPIRLLKKFTPDKKFYLKRFGNPEIIKTL